LIYLDTSVVAPFYWQEQLSDTVQTLLGNESEVALSQLVEVELFSALSRRVRMGEISQDQAGVIAERFETHVDYGFYTRLSVEGLHYSLAKEWIRRFDTPLRTLDALHLAIASSQGICLITADRGLAGSAEAFGVEVRLLTLPEGA
jgi:uncharacterized protein